MKTEVRKVFEAFVWIIVVAVGGISGQANDYDICVSLYDAEIPIGGGTYVFTAVVNNGHEALYVSEPIVTVLPQFPRPCPQRSYGKPAPIFLRVEPGGTRFFRRGVGFGYGFFEHDVGSHDVTVECEIRTEKNQIVVNPPDEKVRRVFTLKVTPLPDQVRTTLVEYTDEIELCDGNNNQQTGLRFRMADQAEDLKSKALNAEGMKNGEGESEDWRKTFAALASSVDLTSCRKLQAYLGAWSRFDYESTIAGFEKALDGRLKMNRQLFKEDYYYFFPLVIETKEPMNYRIKYSLRVLLEEGKGAALKYLQEISAEDMNCVDRLFFDRVYGMIVRADKVPSLEEFVYDPSPQPE